MRKRVVLLLLCLAEVLTLSIGYAWQAMPLVYFAQLGFALVLIFNTEEFLLPILLFFLPWDPLLKVSPDSFTIFTLSIPFILIVFLVKNRESKELMDAGNLLIVLAFACITLLTKMAMNVGISGSYIQFLFMLIFVPMYAKVYVDKIEFYNCIIFLGMGAISAGLASKILMAYSHMSPYIIREEWQAVGLLRLSGFYGDSNFYSLHFLAAVAGTLVLISKSKGRGGDLVAIIGVAVLVYYGMMSVSKMFIMCLSLVLILWLWGLFAGREKASKKMIIFAGTGGLLALLYFFKAFTEQIQYYLFRFGSVYDANSFTTGRSTLWLDYANYVFSQLNVFILGIGYTEIEWPNFAGATHNILLQTVFQIGIAGFILMALWVTKLIRSVPLNMGIGFENKVYHLIILAGFFLPWLSLDMLYYNEFFYALLLYLVFRKQMNGWEKLEMNERRKGGELNE